MADIDIAGLLDPQGRVALVTGASSGLGARFARVLDAAGAAVVLAAARVDRLDQLASEIVDGVAVACDVSDPDHRERQCGDGRHRR